MPSNLSIIHADTRDFLIAQNILTLLEDGRLIKNNRGEWELIEYTYATNQEWLNNTLFKLKLASKLLNSYIEKTNNHPELVSILETINNSITDIKNHIIYENLSFPQKIATRINELFQRIKNFFSELYNTISRVNYTSEGSACNEAVAFDLNRDPNKPQPYHTHSSILFSQKIDAKEEHNVSANTHKQSTNCR